MSTITDKLADALRALRHHATQQELYEAHRAADEVLAAYDAQPEPAPGQIGIRMEGGVVQAVFTDRPMDVIVLDYDTDGADPDDLFDMPQDDGSTEECLVSEYPADVMPAECARIAAALDARDDAVADESEESETPRP